MKFKTGVLGSIAIAVALVGLTGCANMKKDVAGVTHKAQGLMGMTSSSHKASSGHENLGPMSDQLQGKILKVTSITFHGKVGQLAGNVGNQTNSYSSQYADQAIESKAGYGWLGSVSATLANHLIHHATAAAENKAAARPGLRIVVQTNNNGSHRIVTVKQPGKTGVFKEGEKVLVDLYASGAVRVETL